MQIYAELSAIDPAVRPVAQLGVRLFLLAERRVTFRYPRSGFPTPAGRIWEVSYYLRYLQDRLAQVWWRACYYLGLPEPYPYPPPAGGTWYLVDFGRFPSFSSWTGAFSDSLDYGALWNFLDDLKWPPEEVEDLVSYAEERLAQLIQEVVIPELENFLAQLDQAMQVWSAQVQPTLEAVESLSFQIELALNPFESYYLSADPRNGTPAFVFRDPNSTNDRSVIPNSSNADLITGDGLVVSRLNLYDLICLSTQTILAYLGAQTFPRGWYPPDGDTTQLPQWQIGNLSDAVAQVHQELRDTSFVRAEIRTGPQEEDKEEVVSSLPEAVGALLGAVSEIALDTQRTHLLSAQAARTALTVSAQIGTRTFPGTIDLGWRGKVFAPSTDSASLLQVLAAIETQLNAISVALGIAPKPPEQE